MRPPPGEVVGDTAALPGYARRADTDQGARSRAGAKTTGRIALLNPAWITVAASLGLVGVGLTGISLASGLSGSGLTPLAVRQATFLALGVGVASVAAIFDYRRLSRHVHWLAIGTLGLLVFVLIPFIPESIVRPVNGARRWINLGVADFQPSELAKVVFVLLVGAWLRFRSTQRTWLGLMAPALMAVVPMGLILVEPDLGTAVLFMPALVAMLVAAGAKLAHLLTTCAIGVVFAASVAGTSLLLAQADQYPLLRPHQVERIQAMLDVYRGDERFVDGRGFQGRQARMLVGAGGVAGHDEERARALVHFSSLPERHNDMVYAVIANRFGVAGGVGVLTLYGLWIAGALWTAGRCKDAFGRIMVVGFAAFVFTQMSINIGMTIGLLPITGMTLPFVSYGGSSLLMAWLMVGLVMSVALRRPSKLWRESFEFGR
ncbi:MAG: FtsW/RodA/SpoVE family cell cycle protein [Planctomycetota bacterium]